MINGKFIGRHYRQGDTSVRCEVGDKCLIHPTKWGRSQAKKSYPVVVTINEKDKMVTLKGRAENINWHGAWINNYAFNRLEFVSK